MGGKSLEGAIAPTGPVMVAEQLPDGNPIKKVALDFTKAYEGSFGAGAATLSLRTRRTPTFLRTTP